MPPKAPTFIHLVWFLEIIKRDEVIDKLSKGESERLATAAFKSMTKVRARLRPSVSHYHCASLFAKVLVRKQPDDLLLMSSQADKDALASLASNRFCSEEALTRIIGRYCR